MKNTHVHIALVDRRTLLSFRNCAKPSIGQDYNSRPLNRQDEVRAQVPL
jgi:hypothetical protein